MPTVNKNNINNDNDKNKILKKLFLFDNVCNSNIKL